MVKIGLYTMIWLLPGLLKAYANPVIIPDNFKSIQAGYQVSYIEDPHHTLTYRDVFNMPQSRFLKNERPLIHFGYTRSTYWFKLVVKNHSDRNDFLLEIGNPQLDSIRLYQFTNSVLTAQKNKEDLLAHNIGSSVFRNTLAQPFTLKPTDSVTFIIKMHSITALKNQLTIYSHQAYKDIQQVRLFIYSFFTGIMCFVLIFSAFLYLVINDRVYLYYTGYVLSFWFTIISISGYLVNSPVGQHDLRQLFTFPLLILALKFTDSFLLIRRYKPLLSRIIQWAIYYVLFCLLLYLLYRLNTAILHQSKNFRQAVALLYNLMLLTSCTLIFTSILMAIKNGYLTGWFYLVGLSPVITTTVLGVLGNARMISFYLVIDYYLVFAVVFEITVLYLGLAYRFKMYKDNQEKLLIEYNNSQKELVKSLITGQEMERKRLSEELHDGLGQWLAITKLHIDNIPVNGNQDKIQTVRNYIDSSIKELRHISHDMMPVALIHGGIVPALNEIADTINSTGKIEVSLYCASELENRLTSQTEIAIFRIIQEALTNIVKHAGATQASIQMAVAENKIKLMIEDNGIGFDYKSNPKGNGIKNILSRVQLLNGSIEFSSTPGNGTVLFIDIPLAY